MVKLFADGGWAMWPLLVLLIIGIAVAIERLITLSRASIDAEEFFRELEGALKVEDRTKQLSCARKRAVLWPR